MVEFSQAKYLMITTFVNIRLSVFICFFVLTIGCSSTTEKDEPNEHLTPLERMSEELTMELGIPVVVTVQQHQVYNEWHYYVGYPVHKEGSRIDINLTRYKNDYQEGYFDDVFMALFRVEDDQQKLVRHSYGATDAPFVGWAETYNLPLCFFNEKNECGRNI